MSARRYYDILIDTLLIRSLEPFAKAGRRRIVQHPRYYLFDVGVLNGALRNFEASGDRIGTLFEHLVLQVIHSEAAARDLDCRISVYLTESGAEVDFVVELDRKTYAVEVKAARTVGRSDLRGLRSFGDFFGRDHTPMVIYRGERALSMDGVAVLPLSRALSEMGLG